MNEVRRILFAVRDPGAARQPGIEKAMQVARCFGASLELFHALSSPVFLSLQPKMDATIEQLRQNTLEKALGRLAKFVARGRRRGIATEACVEWDYPPHEAIVRRAVRIGADLIVAECHKGARTRAWLMHLTDWELLRASSLPVLLLKSGRPYRRPRILAAVDPGHAHSKPAGLDADIVGAAALFSRALRGSLHLMHASHPSTMALALGDPNINAASVALTYDELRAQARADFERFAATTSVPAARTHLVEGHPAFAIPRSARKVHAGLTVMGAVSRSGLKRVFIGNTAERVLNALPCDVLVLKPRDFEPRVTRKSRGMRIVTPPPMAPIAS
jgi:universal stress protein E